MTQTAESYTPSPVLVAEGEPLCTLRLERSGDGDFTDFTIFCGDEELGSVSKHGAGPVALYIHVPETLVEDGIVELADGERGSAEFLAAARRGQRWAQRLIERGCEDLLAELCEAMGRARMCYSAVDLGFSVGAATEAEERARAAGRGASLHLTA